MSTPIRLKYRTEEREIAHRRAIHHSGYTTNEWYRVVCNTAADGTRGVPTALHRRKAKDPPRVVRGAITIRPTDYEKKTWELCACEAGWPLQTWIMLVTDAAANYGDLHEHISNVR